RAQGRGSEPGSQHGLLTQDRSRADLRDDLAVDLDVEHSVEQHEGLVARLPLLDECLAPRDTAADELRALAEDRRSQPALELRLDGCRKGRRLDVAPRRALFELELEGP